jgi:hypothetical protein
MKLSNIFKKDTKTVAKANVEKVEKTQLGKIIGGIDTIVAETTVQNRGIDKKDIRR